MRNIKIICIASLILWVFISCTEKEPKYPAIRRIINETNNDIKFNIYAKNGKFVYDIFALDSLDIEGVCYGGIHKGCDLGTSQWGGVDSASLIFSNTKIQKFKFTGDYNAKIIYADHFVLRFGYTLVTKDNGGITTYVYYITQEDYDNAEECGGSCE